MRIILLVLFCLFWETGYAQQPVKYLIKAGKFFDSEKKQFLKDQYILVEGNKIIKVAQSAESYKAGSQFIDLSSSTVIPGLIDSHTHFLFKQKSSAPMENDLIENSDSDRLLRGAGIARSYLDAGITSVRDLGNSGQYLDLTLRNAINKGWISGPRMFISGPIISPPYGQFGPKLPYFHQSFPEKEYSIIQTVDEARSTVLEHKMKGVDLIKICATNDNGLVLSPEQMQAIVEVAHKGSLKVTAHAPYDEIIADAVNAGVDGIEHAYGISESTLQLMARKGAYLVPTDGTFAGYKGIVDFSKGAITEAEIREFVANTTKRLKLAVKSGVQIVYGSDMYLYGPKSPGAEAKNAVASYLEAGLSVEDVLQISTYNGAVALGKKNLLGVIKEGAFADIVAFDGDLEKDFVKLLYDKVNFVMKDGKIHLNNGK